MGSYSFSHSSWCMGLPSEVSAILDKEGFTSLSLAPLKHATEDDTKPNFSGLRVEGAGIAQWLEHRTRD